MTSLNDELQNLKAERERRQAIQSLEALRAEQARRRLAPFLRAAWHVVEPVAPLVWGWHLDAICEHLEAVTAGQIKNLLITIPPGCTKTITACVMWPVWTWCKQPSLRFLIGANEADLAVDASMKSRNLINSDWFKKYFGDCFQLLPDQNQKTWFDNDHTGRRQCTSVGSAITGKKSDVLVLDDANDAHKVRSLAERKHVNGWVKDAWYDRVNDFKTARRVVIGQRTDVDDAIGYLKGSGGWEELCIPEEFEPQRKTFTSIGWSDPRKKPGELLRPDRFGQKEIETAKGMLGTIGYRSKHQQDPQTLDGFRFRKTWFRYWRWDGDFMVLEDERRGAYRFQPKNCLRFGTVDDAASARTSADFTVIASWLISPRNDLVWVGCRREQLEIPDQPKLVVDEYNRHRLQFIGIERVAAKNALFQYCLREKIAARPLDPMGEDKLTRAATALVLCETGRVWLPSTPEKDFPLGEIEAELLAFTGLRGADKHDDCVDVLAYASQVITNGGAAAPGKPGSTTAPNPLSGQLAPAAGLPPGFGKKFGHSRY